MQEEPSELKSRATKEELVAEIERLKAANADLQDKINQQAVTAKSGKRGWMISTPNPDYTGRTAGVWFENGHAFVPEDWHDAQRRVGILTGDFGYSATFTEDGREIAAPKPKKMSVEQAATVPQVVA